MASIARLISEGDLCYNILLMKTRHFALAALAAVGIFAVQAETIEVPAGQTIKPTKAIVGDTLVKTGEGTLDLSGVALKNAGLIIREGTVHFAVEAPKGKQQAVKTRHLRWTITGTRPNDSFSGSGPQFSEFRLFKQGQPVAFPSTTKSTSHNHAAGEGADKGFDGDLKTKCYQHSPFVLDFGTLVEFDAYSYATANDAIGRDSRDWVLEIGEKRNGRIYWQMAGMERGFTAPTARFTEAGKLFPVVLGGSFPVDYPIEVGGKGKLILDGIGGRLEKISGSGLIQLSNSSLTLPEAGGFTGSVVGGTVTYEPTPLF